MDKKIISIDENVLAETSEDMFNKTYSALKNSVSSEGIDAILTGKVSGVETVNKMPVAVIFYDMFKIIIPAVEFMDVEVREGNDPMNLYRILMNKRLGSEVDYIVKVVDKDKKIAIASRKEAMKIIKDQAYFAKDENGNYVIEEDSILETRVVAVMRAGIIVEAFGVETYIPPKDLSYSRVYDSAELFTQGDRVLVKVKGIERGADNKVVLVFSVKEAYDNPIGENIAKYNEGDIYTGKVTLIDNKNVFVKLDGNVDVLCKYPTRLNPLVDSEVAVRITLKNTDMNRLFGIIINVARV